MTGIPNETGETNEHPTTEPWFDLRIEFSGLCLFVRRKDKKRVSVLMPDARRQLNIETMRHDDGTVAVPHAGYLRFDLGNALSGFAPAFSNSNAPRHEGVHRFDREELDLGLDDAAAVGVDELEFPDFGVIDSGLKLRRGLYGDNPPPQLLMRTTLHGGKFVAHSGGSNWTFPDILAPDGDPYQGQFANAVTWSTRVFGKNGLTLTVTPFGMAKADGIQIELNPSEPNRLIRLKISNLCAENPLEWPELGIRVISGTLDKDFKWLYRLFEKFDDEVAADGAPIRAPAKLKLLVPVLDRTSGPAGREQDCTGGKTDGDE